MKQKVELNEKTILVTGAAGFIGSNLVIRLLNSLFNSTIIGIDCMTDYNPISLKIWRLKRIEQVAKESNSKWVYVKENIANKSIVDDLFSKYRFNIVVNLAAQAGVRYSIDHPDVYIDSNIIGFYNILEASRKIPVEHLIYASSSSVYGGNKKRFSCIALRCDKEKQ